jgi:hypothetical protein
MTTEDVMGEFMRSEPHIDGTEQTHYLDANAMAAEIVRLRAMVERVRFLCERAAEKTADGYVDAYSILDALGDV